VSNGSRRGRWVVVLLVAAAVTAVAGTPAWLRASGASALEGGVTVAVSGSQAAPGVIAAAIVLLAAAGAVGLAGRVARWVVVGVVVAAGAVVAGSVVGVLRDPGPVATVAVSARTGVSVLTGPAVVTPWPWVALATGLVDVLLGIGLARSSARWGVTSRRHVPATAGASEIDDDASAWDALTRGDDPTRD
jgi:hypothetical protein